MSKAEALVRHHTFPKIGKPESIICMQLLMNSRFSSQEYDWPLVLNSGSRFDPVYLIIDWVIDMEFVNKFFFLSLLEHEPFC